MKKVLLLMSGGVDAIYCAYLIQNQGYNVYGFSLNIHNTDQKHKNYTHNIHT